MSVRVIKNEAHFQSELVAAGVRLVVVDFTATWCGPCQRIAPHFEMLPSKYPKAVFLKVDVDKCQDTAASQGVSAMPTFIFYKNRIKVGSVQGADINALEAKIQELVLSVSGEDNAEDFGHGFIDLNGFISKAESECLNECDDHPLAQCLTSSGGYLQSDCDEQLILSITFNQAVKIHSIKLKAPPQCGPKDIKLFINHPRTIDFDQAESMLSVQEFSLNAEELKNGTVINLRYVKFQNVQNIQIFVKNNQSGSNVTQIEYIGFIGTPIMMTKMDNFKRIVGKKGESH